MTDLSPGIVGVTAPLRLLRTSYASFLDWQIRTTASRRKLSMEWREEGGIAWAIGFNLL